MTTVQRKPSSSSPRGAASPTTAVQQPGDSKAGSGQRDFDELARRLYGPISRRLRAELRADRERSGRFTGHSASGR